jgi:hypothetical protein
MSSDWRYCDTEYVTIEPIPLTDYAWMASVVKLVVPKRLSAPKVRRKRLRKKVRKATNYSYGAYRKIYINEEIQDALGGRR